MDVINSILNKNEVEFNRLFKTVDINFTNNGFTLLWIAINGAMTRPKTKNEEFADCNIITTLLEHGADPNKKCVLMTPLYSAVYHNRSDVIRLLLLYGANPNEFSLIKCLNKNKLLFEIPLNLAIRDTDVEIVKILLLHDVLYNKITLEKIVSGINRINKDTCNTYNYIMLKKLRNILNALQSNYQDSLENKVDDIIKNNPKLGAFPPFYSCFQKFTLIR